VDQWTIRCGRKRLFHGLLFCNRAGLPLYEAGEAVSRAEPLCPGAGCAYVAERPADRSRVPSSRHSLALDGESSMASRMVLTPGSRCGLVHGFPRRRLPLQGSFLGVLLSDTSFFILFVVSSMISCVIGCSRADRRSFVRVIDSVNSCGMMLMVFCPVCVL
jgi:hypothetical protein